ncbi:MAG TPA: methyltransferase domain-containing protein [Puia sp.]|uniref:methyltransferase domain-containing protein n=1 Tax=Puia sp. TaxID=2045100 RepID=UPI002C23AA0E|nr:methyltransferase domain-containing protein [Puia sp.]HVU96451.1 methyltransferase domain-containing protein [Puia sp.]
MDKRLLSYLCCPVTKSPLRLKVIKAGPDGEVLTGLLFAAEDWCYPVTGGIPRLLVEAFLEHAGLLRAHLPDYDVRKRLLDEKYPGLLEDTQRKNRKTKESFALEWSLHDYAKDRTWEVPSDQLLRRFLEETGETEAGLAGKLVFDAGCGNGQLDTAIARAGARVIAMDLSGSIDRAYSVNDHRDVWFIQGDVQFPPVAEETCDILQCSGVLHHTPDTELSFCRLEPCVREGGIYSVWLYHPRKDWLHQWFNFLRKFTSCWPARTTYRLLLYTAFPVSHVIHWVKGKPRNRREIMIALMDWFSPEFRYEHRPEEVRDWFTRCGYRQLQVTTTDVFGFNFTGRKGARAISARG